jgi:dipeptidyl aminopeptidase/acylaminoacyl peptidase
MNKSTTTRAPQTGPLALGLATALLLTLGACAAESPAGQVGPADTGRPDQAGGPDRTKAAQPDDTVAASAQWALASTIELDVEPWDLEPALTLDGRQLFVPVQYEDLVLMVDTSTGKVKSVEAISQQSDDFPVSLATSPQGDLVYVINYYGSLSVLDPSTGAVLAWVGQVAVQPKDVEFSHDGTRAYVASYTRGGSDEMYAPDPTEGMLSVIDTSSHRLVTRILAGPHPGNVVVSPDDQRVYVSGQKTRGRFYCLRLSESISIEPST